MKAKIWKKTKTLGITTGTTLLKSVLDDKVSPAMENSGGVQKLTSPHGCGAVKKEWKPTII